MKKVSDFHKLLLATAIVAFTFLFGNMNLCFTALDLFYFFGGFFGLLICPIILGWNIGLQS